MFSLRSIPLRSIPLKSAKLPLSIGSAPATLRCTFYAVARDPMSLSDAIKKDHRELQQYYNEVVNNPGNHDHQQRYGNQFTWELARHSVAEELVVYPAFEKYLGKKGKQMAEDDRKEHRLIKERLKVFQRMSSTDPDYIPKLNEIWRPLSDHIKGEEEHDLVSLEAALKSESEQLATSFGTTKSFVPSRSHPSAGEHPPFETAMGLLMAPIDRLADMFRRFPKSPDDAPKLPDDARKLPADGLPNKTDGMRDARR